MGRVAQFDKLNILKQKIYLHFNEQKNGLLFILDNATNSFKFVIRILLLNCFGVLLYLLSVYVFEFRIKIPLECNE